MTAAALQELHDATAYYTTLAVVDELLDLVGWPGCGGCLLDPGAGDGAFLVRAVERLELPTDGMNELAGRVEAWEIHPAATSFARANLREHLVGRGWSAEAASTAAYSVVHLADFLTPGPIGRRFRVAAGNPPYLRYARLPEKLKRRYARVPDWARQDLLHMFLGKASDVLEPEGRIAFVTADRWLFNESAGRLREALGERFGVESVRRLDVTTSFYQAKTRRKGTPPRIHPVAVLLGPGGVRLSAAPMHIERVDVPEGARPLGEVAQIRLAPWVGPKGVFLLDRADAREFPRSAWVPCVDTDDIEGGLLGRPTRVVLRAARGARPHRMVLEHVRRNRWRLPERARRSQATCPWAQPEPWGPLPYKQEALLVPRIARELTTVRLPKGVLPINHNLTVVSSELPLARLEAMLRATEAKAWIAAHAARLESGYLSVTTNLLRKLPVCP